MKIVHIITGLEEGGAEKTLYKICKYDIFNEHTIISIISLKDSDKYYSLLNDLGIKIYSLDIKFYSVIKFLYLVKLIKSLKPNVIQTWLVHGDLIGGIASRLAGFNQIVWNVRYSKLERGVVKLRTLFLIKILSKLSFIIPKIIITVSDSALENCKNLGYSNHKLRLIYNGYEAIDFDPKNYKDYYRKKYDIDKNIPIIGSVARFDPTKDHQNLFEALSIIKKKNVNFICLLIGPNIDENNNYLVNLIKKFNLNNSIKLLSKSSDILKSMSGLDIHILNSKTEGFPNVVAEAMSCGTPSIVTNVGDSAFIVGKTGWVVEPNDSNKLAEIIEKALAEIGKDNWKVRCDQAMIRIRNKFEIKKMIVSYNKIWTEIDNKIKK